ETCGLLSGGVLASLRPGAFLVNVGRGNLMSERDLVEALECRLAGAALDVFENEPLPRESPLWRQAKVLVTPHDVDRSPRTSERSRRLFFDNLRRFASRRTLRNVVSYRSEEHTSEL